MGVLDGQDADATHLLPVDASMGMGRGWMVRRLKQQAGGMHQVNGELAGEVTHQGVGPAELQLQDLGRSP